MKEIYKYQKLFILGPHNSEPIFCKETKTVKSLEVPQRTMIALIQKFVETVGYSKVLLQLTPATTR